MTDEKNRESQTLKTKGIYLLPNLLTTSALFAAFYSIVAAMKGLFDVAAIAIFVAMLADGLDGRVARLTNTQTAFGAQYDSLSDMASFGIAPALIIYSWSLIYLGKMGWLIAFIYAAAVALRLARFNTQPIDYDKRYFQGLPCPPAAAVVASMVWLGGSYAITGMYIALPAAAIILLIAAFMVSRIRYASFKEFDFKQQVSFFVIALLVFIIAGVALAPAPVLFAISLGYAFSGPVNTLWQLRKIRKRIRNESKKRH